MAVNEDLKLKHPFRLLVSGSSVTGKTTFVRQFLKEFKSTTDINKPIISVLYMHGQDQPLFSTPISDRVCIRYVKGFTDEFEDDRPDVIVIDDLMTEMGDDKRLTALFTKGSHHLNISVMFLVQNLFHKGKEMRSISLNAQYIVTMRNPRDRLQIMALGRQIFPSKSRFFNAAYDVALAEPFSHLLIDISPTCPDDARLRQRSTVKGERGFTVFVPS